MNNADQPAMPFEGGENNMMSPAYGLTKREHFAAMAMQGILANGNYEPPRRNKLAGMAIDAVSAADALLAELEKGDSNDN